MIRVIPAANISNQELVVALDGVDYIFRILWNARCRRWFMSVRSAANADLITGRKLCANMPWSSHETIDGKPAGQLWIYDVEATDPDLKDLGDRSQILYVEDDSVT